MNDEAPIREPIMGSQSWASWLKRLVMTVSGWNRSLTAALTHDFGSIAAASQASATVTVTGARDGSAVLVTPSADTTGISYSGVVTANDTVTIYAKNFTAGAINPASTTFRVIVFQQ